MHVDKIGHLVKAFAVAVNNAMLVTGELPHERRIALRSMAHDVLEALATRTERRVNRASSARSAEAARQRADERFELWWRSSDRREFVRGWDDLGLRTGLSLASLRSKFSTGKGAFTRLMWDKEGNADNVTITRIKYAPGVGRPRGPEKEEIEVVKTQKPKAPRDRSIRAAPVGGRMRR